MKVVAGTEASSDALAALLDRVGGYPLRGTHVGGGFHEPIAATWDGTGAPPFGWTKHLMPELVASPTDAVIPLDDQTVALAAQSGVLSGPEKATIAAAAAARVDVPDPFNGGARLPKASAVVAAQKGAATDLEVTSP